MRTGKSFPVFFCLKVGRADDGNEFSNTLWYSENEVILAVPGKKKEENSGSIK